MRQIISTGKGPNAIGPNSQAVRGGQFIFVSGQIPLDPATQKIIDGDISQQTERVLQSIGGDPGGGGLQYEQSRALCSVPEKHE